MQLLRRSGPGLTTGELHDILALRVNVFVVEQACPYAEIDGRDLEPTTVHWWLAEPADNRAGVAAYLRTLVEPDGTVRVGRVVTRADHRNQGLSARLITAALVEVGHQETVLAAQSHLRSFYQRFGYAVSGDEFLEDGIPHLPMRRPAVVS